MNIDDHDKHYAFLYYPSNAYRIGSEEEFLFFKNKWNAKSDRKRVRRIYEDFRRLCDTCPCRALFAFNVLNASVYKNDKLINLTISEQHDDDGDVSITRLAFTNEYQLKTSFFPKRFEKIIQDFNEKRIRNDIQSLETQCEFGKPITDGKSTIMKLDKIKKPEQNRRKLEKIEPILREAVEIAYGLMRDVDRIKRIIQKISVDDVDKTIYCLLNMLRKRARAKYLKLDYFGRFRTILSDFDMYFPRLSKNKNFKKKREIVKKCISEDCIKFWGIERQRLSLAKSSTSNNTHSLSLGGQLLPINDNPLHDWYNLSSRCKHDGGVKIVYAQTRCNDEMISSFTYCNLCHRQI